MTHQNDALDGVDAGTGPVARGGVAGRVLKLAFLALVLGLFAVIMLAWAALLVWTAVSLGGYVLSFFW